MANLIKFEFTDGPDNAENLVRGWDVSAGETINALSGDDSITGGGNGIGISNDGVIMTGADNDTVTGSGFQFGLDNKGIIRTGVGSDRITGIGGGFSIVNIGLLNRATIETGNGEDSIKGSSNKEVSPRDRSIGIWNIGIIDTDEDNDIIEGNGGEAGIGIDNRGRIKTGKDNDTITGIGLFGIDNFGTINTGDGNDAVDALRGGFGGDGTIKLDDGDDKLKGFGEGIFDGGKGVDELKLNRGTYTINDNQDGTYSIERADTVMTVTQFEAFGNGANETDFLAAAAAGSVTFA